MKVIIFLILLFCSTLSWAFDVHDVEVTCPESTSCTERTVKFKTLAGDYRSLVHLKDTLRLMSSDGGYQYFGYNLIEENEKNILKIRFKLKPTISEVNVGFLDRNLPTDPSQLISVKEGDFFEEQKLKATLDVLPKKLENMGYPYNSYEWSLNERGDKININVVITLGLPIIFKKVHTNTNSPFINNFLKQKFIKFYDLPFEMNRYKLLLDEAHKELFSYGYYLIGLDFTPTIKENRVTLEIKVHNDQLYAFDFRNLHQEDQPTMLALMKDIFRKYKRPLTEVAIKQAVQEHFESRALLNNDVDVVTSKFTNKFREEVTLYRLKFDEKYKTRLKKVIFQGNVFYSTKKLKKMFDKEAFELASIDFYDQEYFTYFANSLKKSYITKGFVQVKIQDPIKTFDAEKRVASVEYIIQEGQRAFVKGISFEGLPEGMENNVLALLKNKVSVPFNPLALVEDIKKVSAYLQEQGYYFAEVLNAVEEDLVTYSKSGADVEIHFKVVPGPIVKLNRVIYIGNYKTRKKVISKKVKIEKDELITPSKTRDIESALSATGLFTSVNVTPIRHNSSNAATDLIVRVSERDYGLVEFAPGYRTDLGIKLTGTASYTNIGGMNRALTLTGQVNQRLNYQVFDERRRKERREILEYNTNVTFTQGDVFDTLIDYSASLANQRRRFYSFDADIYRFNNVFTRDLSKRLSSSVRYQYETITQSDASKQEDNGSFKIGAITPSLTYDLRNSQTLPTKGAFFNLSCEFANPYFLSQKNTELTVNYYKLMSRNRFYIPFKNGTVAISMVGGVQENLAQGIVRDENGDPEIITETNDANQVVRRVERTQGYIPNIKVFRLTGMDIVRGFTDQEINMLSDKRDITSARIQNHAFLANFKLEPRYFINDGLMAGVFVDAGRVYVDKYDLGDLRSSAGLTFKIITPVGTLDFDYGIKLLRKKDAKGRLESPGRLHVSIGFF